jgi:hypothetical protein
VSIVLVETDGKDHSSVEPVTAVGGLYVGLPPNTTPDDDDPD